MEDAFNAIANPGTVNELIAGSLGAYSASLLPFNFLITGS